MRLGGWIWLLMRFGSDTRALRLGEEVKRTEWKNARATIDLRTTRPQLRRSRFNRGTAIARSGKESRSLDFNTPAGKAILSAISRARARSSRLSRIHRRSRSPAPAPSPGPRGEEDSSFVALQRAESQRSRRLAAIEPSSAIKQLKRPASRPSATLPLGQSSVSLSPRAITDDYLDSDGKLRMIRARSTTARSTRLSATS